MEYRHIIKNSKHRLVWIKSFANKIGRLYQWVDGRVELVYTFFSDPQQYTWKQKERCDIWADCCGLSPPKILPVLHPPHIWRQPNKIYRVGHHMDSRSNNWNFIIQQYYFNPVCVPHVLQNQEILSWNPHGTLWIYFHSNKHNTGGNNRTIQPQIYGVKWTCLWWYQKRNIRPPTGRENSKLFPYQKLCNTWILQVSSHTYPMGSQI